MNRLWLRDDLARAWRGINVFEHVQGIEGQVFKQKDNRVVLRFVQDGRALFLKLHRGVGWQEIFKNLSQLKAPILGAENEYRALIRLQELGIDTLTPVGYGKAGENPATQMSFLITEELGDTVTLEDFTNAWKEEAPTYAIKRALIERLAVISEQFHSNGMNHRDFYLCHFLMKRAGVESAEALRKAKIFLVDLHRAQLRSKVPMRWQVKDVGSLYFSAMELGLERRDYFRFMRLYTGKDLAETLEEDGKFWLQVRARAERLFRKVYKREPEPF